MATYYSNEIAPKENKKIIGGAIIGGGLSIILLGFNPFGIALGAIGLGVTALAAAGKYFKNKKNYADSAMNDYFENSQIGDTYTLKYKKQYSDLINPYIKVNLPESKIFSKEVQDKVNKLLNNLNPNYKMKIEKTSDGKYKFVNKVKAEVNNGNTKEIKEQDLGEFIFDAIKYQNLASQKASQQVSEPSNQDETERKKKEALRKMRNGNAQNNLTVSQTTP